MEKRNQDLNSEIESQREDLRIEQNFPLAILVGVLAALVGAALWGLTISLTGYQKLRIFPITLTYS